MAKGKKNIGGRPGGAGNPPDRPGGPPGGNDSQDPTAAGRELGKKVLAMAGRSLRRSGRQLNALFVRATTRIPERNMNGVNTKTLAKRMAKINWNKDYSSPAAIARSENSPRLQRQIMRVNAVLRDLKKLSDSDNYMGEEIRWKLQRKFWTNTGMKTQMGNTREALTTSTGVSESKDRGQVTSSQTTPAKRALLDISNGNVQSESRRTRIAIAAARIFGSGGGRQRKPGKHMGI